MPDDTTFQALNPLLKRSHGNFIELIHTNKIIFWEDFGRQLADDSIFFLSSHLKEVTRMDTFEGILTIIQVIIPLTNIEIENSTIYFPCG